MTRLISYGVFFLALLAIGNSFARYGSMRAVEESGRAPDVSEHIEEKLEFFKEKFDFLRHKSIVLDKSVETNRKLFYLTHSDDFEEALFLIDYLTERFEAMNNGHEANEVTVADIGFYLQRLEENLVIVERDLKSMDELKVAQE